MIYDPIRERVHDTIVRAIERDQDEDGITDAVMQQLGEVNVTVALALVNRVHALEEALRRLADAGYPIADHERGYPAGSVDVVLDGKRIGPDDGVHRVTVTHLRELGEAIVQAEEAFWPTDTVDLAPDVFDEEDADV